MSQRGVSLQNGYRSFVSDYDMKQYGTWKHFFLFWFLEHTQEFEVTVSGATRVKGLKPSLPSHFETSKYERLNVF